MGKGIGKVERLGRDSYQPWAMLRNGSPGTQHPNPPRPPQQGDGNALPGWQGPPPGEEGAALLRSVCAGHLGQEAFQGVLGQKMQESL